MKIDDLFEQGFGKMLSGSLGLEEPWFIERVNCDSTNQEFHIYVGVRNDAMIVCPRCGGATKRYGYETSERVWRHMDCLHYLCYVHAKRPRVQCPHCGVVQVSAPFERPNSRFTILFESYALLIMTDVPRRRASFLLRCNEKSLASILSYWVNDAVSKLDFGKVTKLAIDETSFKRNHEYVTVTVDPDERRVIDVQQGRSKASVQAMKDKLERQGGDATKIESVTCDMSAAYLSAVEEYFPNAKLAIDKFHLKQLFINALDEVRKEDQREANEKRRLFASRRLLTIPESKMSKEQIAEVNLIAQCYPRVGRAFRIVQALDVLYSSQTVEEAAELLKQLYSWMRRCRLEPMKDVALTLAKHSQRILNYFHNRLTNAICEGINSMIQAAKRKARGFRTLEGFISMIYLIAGKLRLDILKPF